MVEIGRELHFGHRDDDLLQLLLGNEMCIRDRYIGVVPARAPPACAVSVQAL